jgi:hypothetical protein
MVKYFDLTRRYDRFFKRAGTILLVYKIRVKKNERGQKRCERQVDKSSQVSLLVHCAVSPSHVDTIGGFVECRWYKQAIGRLNMNFDSIAGISRWKSRKYQCWFEDSWRARFYSLDYAWRREYLMRGSGRYRI